MKAFLFLRIFTVVNLLIAMGFSVAGMLNPAAILPPNTPGDKAVTIFALYAAARAVPIAVIGIISIFYRRWSAMLVIGFLAGVIQFLDGFIGVYQNAPSKSIGPFVIAVVQIFAVYLVAKQSPAITES
jgi:hypothetical protein